METICMKCQILFPGKKKKSIINLSSAELAQQVCLFVLRFYGPINPMGSCQGRSAYLSTRFTGQA